MSVYEKHVFVCTRGEWCPSIDGDGIGVHAALKEAIRAAGLADRIRINQRRWVQVPTGERPQG